jgi:hypothetical protein
MKKNKEAEDALATLMPGPSKIKIITELFQGGGIGDELKRQMRPGITPIIEEHHGKDFAEHNYWYISQHVINIALFMYCPELCKTLSFQKDQIEIVKERYPLQLQMVKSVIYS